MQPLIMPINGKAPRIHESAFIAPGAVIVGDVEVHEDASVWYGSVLRGDTGLIRVGKGSNVQDGTIVHIDAPEVGGTPCLIGENVLVGHMCMLHGCTLEDGAFIGMKSSVLDGAVVESGGFLAAGAFLGPGKRVPKGEMWAGLPAKKMRDLRGDEDKWALLGSMHYVEESRAHAEAIRALRK
ncbi:MAG: gamma carbonic anhydrase family protein [Pseudomonadota bacterium]